MSKMDFVDTSYRSGECQAGPQKRTTGRRLRGAGPSNKGRACVRGVPGGVIQSGTGQNPAAQGLVPRDHLERIGA
jgi:hypothetical protein